MPVGYCPGLNEKFSYVLVWLITWSSVGDIEVVTLKAGGGAMSTRGGP